MKKPTLAEVNAVLAQCGCCPLPRCCPPLLQCRSVTAFATPVGHNPDLDDSANSASDEVPAFMRTRYLSETFNHPQDADITGYGVYPPAGVGGGDSYVNYTRVDSRVLALINSFDRAFEASAGCIATPDAVLSSNCEISGAVTETFYTAYREDAVEGESIGANANFLSGTVVENYVSVAGERTDEHIEWETQADTWDLDHPDYPTEVADYEAAHSIWQADYDAWDIEWNAWLDGGMIGDEPIFDDPEPTLADPRPEEPGEFYPPCTYRRYGVRTDWERVNLGEGWIIRLVPEDPSYENPQYYSFLPSLLTVYGEPTYNNPVTHSEFIALAEAWAAENVPTAFANSELAESDPDYCALADFCGAYKFYGDAPGQPFFVAFEARLFQYRWKLNKCCGYSSITSGWREVYWPLEYLQWLAEIALLGSDDPVPPPPVDLDALAEKKQWLWTGVPPLCPVDSTSDSTAPPLDPHDHEPMWSPWSAIVGIPDGERGRKELRNYFQLCYGTLKDFMPEVTGEVDFSDELPDEP